MDPETLAAVQEALRKLRLARSQRNVPNREMGSMTGTAAGMRGGHEPMIEVGEAELEPPPEEAAMLAGADWSRPEDDPDVMMGKYDASVAKRGWAADRGFNPDELRAPPGRYPRPGR